MFDRGVERTGECNGGYYSAVLEPQRRGERALVAVIQEAYVQASGG